MSHNCSALVLHCMDFRFGKALKKYLEEKNLLGDCDIVSIAGAAKNLVSPKVENDKELALRQIDISKRLHGITKVILINHMDCGAYGGHSAFDSMEIEEKNMRGDMDQAKTLINTFYPDLQVETVLADISGAGEVSFK